MLVSAVAVKGEKTVRKNNFRRHSAKSRDKRRSPVIGYIGISVRFAGMVLLWACVSMGFILLHDFLTQCNYFRASEISVTGAEQLSEAAVMELAEVEPGINLLSVNLSLARERLLLSPWIREAEVRRNLPSGLAIHIVEHNALAVCDLGKGFLINDNGEIFKAYSPAEQLDLPVITGLRFSDLETEDGAAAPLFDAVMKVLRMGQAPESLLPNGKLRRIHVDPDIGITLYGEGYSFGSIRAIKLGYENYSGKYQRLQDIIQYLKENDMSVNIDAIDLNDTERIVVRPFAAEPASADTGEV